ncbi:acyl-CoA/acyl-ACP dehydrogenase [Salicibibacter cibarius]|uniref:Acyl-CoA/acyl-ACP dehydrogenase n=1 Tax=Salicibibacter cibarius TaxID=2743000 RepID=A0A7T6Z3L4_9BACI|nr:acyl-CoA dehydrogenase family protein [Salicibibacter cibarius]QQK76408.1 acyl-CoA/acyl-ACP dehydrogenase [Salicibibacter cibarius]
MSDIQSMLTDTATKIMKDICTKEVINKAEKGEFPQGLWEALEDVGMTSVGVPERAGGMGGDVSDVQSLLKVVGKFSGPIPLAETLLAKWILSVARLPLLDGPISLLPAQKNDQISFRKTDDAWVVTGKAQHIPWARDVENIVIFGATSAGKQIVSTVSTADCQLTHGQNLAGEPRDEVILTDILIESDRVAFAPDLTEADIWDRGSLTRTALMAGALENILELSLTYAKERAQFGRPIGKFQAVKQQLAVMTGEVTASGIAADSAVAAYEHGAQNQEIAMAKIQVGEAAKAVTNIAHQVHGAMGFTDEHPLHHSTRRLWSWRDEYGSESEWADLLGSRVLESGSDDVWSMIADSS